MSYSPISLSNRSPRRLVPAALLRQAALITLASLFWLSFQLKADSITVGVVSFDSIIPPAGLLPGTNGFTIYNFTGANSQPGTPDSPLSFLNASLLLNGSQSVSLGTVAPGSVQPAALQFPTTEAFTEADFTATLNTTSFTIAGQNYVATSNQVTADLLPSTPPDLMEGTDFVAIDINAALAIPSAVPEPNAFWLALGPLASVLLWRRGRS